MARSGATAMASGKKAATVKAPKRVRRDDQASNQWLEAQEVPRAGLPDSNKMARRSRFYRVLIKACIFVVLPLLLFGMVVQFVAAGKSATAPTPTTTGQVLSDSPGRAAATVALTTWINTAPSPLPGGAILQWSGATAVPISTAVPAPAGAPPPTFTTEVDSFVVIVPATGAMFNASLQVAVDPRGGAAAISTPSLTPFAPVSDDGWNTGATWPGTTAATQVSDAVNQAVRAWATAYISGDPSVLRVAVGDPDLSHDYTPLVGAGSATATVSASAVLADPSELLVRAQVSIVWNGQIVDPNKPVAPTSFDLLVSRATTAAPEVVAWGAPGTGTTLTPYANASTRDDLVASGQSSAAQTVISVPASSAPVTPSVATTQPVAPKPTPKAAPKSAPKPTLKPAPKPTLKAAPKPAPKTTPRQP